MIDLSPDWLDLRERLWWQARSHGEDMPATRGSLNMVIAALQRGTMPDQRRWQNLGRAR